VVVAIVAVLAISGEYSSGMIRHHPTACRAGPPSGREGGPRHQ
jgi:hypothetical protein